MYDLRACTYATNALQLTHVHTVCVNNRSYVRYVRACIRSDSESETKIVSLKRYETKFSPSLNFVLDSSLALVALYLIRSRRESKTQQTQHSVHE